MENLSDIQLDALKESMNIGIGKAAAVLSSLIDHPVEISVPEVTFTKFESIKSFLEGHYTSWSSCVHMHFGGEFKGDGVLIFNKESINRWVRVITYAQFGEDEEIVPEMESEMLLEVANIIINGCLGSIGNLLGSEVEFHVPNYFTRVGSGLFDDFMKKNKSDDFGIIINANFLLAQEEISMDQIFTIDKSSMQFVLDRLMSFT